MLKTKKISTKFPFKKKRLNFTLDRTLLRDHKTQTVNFVGDSSSIYTHFWWHFWEQSLFIIDLNVESVHFLSNLIPFFLSTIESTLLFTQILWWKKPHWSDLGKMRFIRKSHDTISMEKSSCRQATMIWIISTQKINAKLQMTHVIAIFIQSLLHWLCFFCPINELELAMWKIS